MKVTRPLLVLHDVINTERCERRTTREIERDDCYQNCDKKKDCYQTLLKCK